MTSRATSRTTEEEKSSGSSSLALPGVLLVQAPDGPAFRAVTAHPSIRIGRSEGLPLTIDDASLSREHTEITRRGDAWEIRDLGSRNGTFVRGMRVPEVWHEKDGALVRAGANLLLLCSDVRPFLALPRVEEEGFVASVKLRKAFDRVKAAAAGGYDLLVSGETGTGKELAAHAFHRASKHASGPLVDVNCATIPESLAERLLFGARRGAFSGADADAPGLFSAADGGVAFLDEVGELDLRVQAKLLRFLETREVVPLGATKGRKVAVQICFATLRELQRAVATHRFRADLYHRVAGLRVELPALRERLEEIPWLIATELARAAPGMRAHPRFVEACMLREWPGNVRELIGEVRRCAQEAQLEGKNELRASDLDEGVAAKAGTGGGSAREIDKETIERALAENGGNVAATARALGLHRRQLYRLLERFGVKGAEG